MRRHPIRAALAGMLPLLVIAALPAQVDWADRLGRPELLGDRLRFLTVSPTLLYTERSGWPAYLTELLWAALFTGLLLAACWRLVSAVADEWTRPVALALALPVLAPLAHLAALLILNVGGFTVDEVGRGADLIRVLTDARDAAGHIMLVALAGAVAVLLTHADRLWPRGPDGEAHVTRESALTLLRGPMPTLWRRIGTAVVAAFAAYLALRVVDDVVVRAAEPVARLWCAGGREPRACATQLAGIIGTAPPDLSNLLLDPTREGLLRLYSIQVFLLFFALAYFQVHTQPLRSRPATTLLTVWYAYTIAVVAHIGVIDAGLGLMDEPGVAGVLALLVPPSGLVHVVVAAPVVGLAFAAVHAVIARIRRRRDPQPSQPGVTRPAS